MKRIARRFVKLFEPPQIDGYLILTDYYYSHGSGGYSYPILIKLNQIARKDENVSDSPAASTTFKAVVKTIRQGNSPGESSGPIIFQSRITPKG